MEKSQKSPFSLTTALPKVRPRGGVKASPLLAFQS
jgi:hypothetical protein